MEDVSCAVDDSVVTDVTQRLCEEFGVDLGTGKWPVELWRSIVHASEDPEQHTLPTWMGVGFPLGIVTEIEHSGVVPRTFEDTASVEASRLEGVVLHDELGDHCNYSSFSEAGPKAQVLLEQMVDEGRAEVVHTWEEVVSRLGPRARLTKMGCMVKIKEDMTEKVRLVFDGRKSGVNGEIHCRERVTLPRISDVADGYLQLLAVNQSW